MAVYKHSVYVDVLFEIHGIRINVLKYIKIELSWHWDTVHKHTAISVPEISKLVIRN